MAYEYNGQTLEATPTGYLVDLEQWNEEVAVIIANAEGIEMTQEHWDVVNYLREEYFNNRGNQPNNRAMLKDLGKLWGKKISSKDMYNLFPGNPSKQAGMIAGVPESMRKGGY